MNNIHDSEIYFIDPKTEKKQRSMCVLLNVSVVGFDGVLLGSSATVPVIHPTRPWLLLS